MAFYAIARELRDVTFGISRTVRPRNTPLQPKPSKDGDSTEVDPPPCTSGENMVTLGVWGVNSTLTKHGVTDCKLQLFSFQTGKLLLEKDLEANLLPNQSTEVLNNCDISKFNPSDVVASVLYQHPITSKQFRSSADWPQPLKYITFADRRPTVFVEGEWVHLHVDKPTKGVILDVEGDDEGVVFNDNGFDIMPYEAAVVHAKGLSLSGRKVKVSWYGEEGKC